MLKDTIIKTRSYRRFHQDQVIEQEELIDLVDCGRLSASAKNVQGLRYVVVNDREMNSKIYPHLKWAGYIQDWDGPVEGERPAAYIVILWDKSIQNGAEFIACDIGIASQSIVLGATEKDLRGCMIWSFNRKEVAKVLDISQEEYEPMLVLALGKPNEEVQIDEMNKDGDYKYWRDDKGIHHVPKRKLEDIIIKRV